MVDLNSMLFQDLQGIVRTLFVGVMAYIALVCFLRISGKRTLAKLNAFDLVVTVALGSTLSARSCSSRLRCLKEPLRWLS
jgi:uncharacterized membrane protein YcaP (DUF421 family)